MARILEFADALKETHTSRRHLLLGNGFSIALFPNIFRYGALLDSADFTNVPEARNVFDLLGTTDFEAVIQALRHSASVLPVYSSDAAAAATMTRHAEALKEILVRAIAAAHPARPSEVTEDQYVACRTFLANFVGASRILQNGKKVDLRGNIYTLNYDLLLYWTLLHDQVVRWDASDPLASFVVQTEELEHDDGFRAPESDPNAAYVTWDAEGRASSTQSIHFLHGGLHLFDYGAELQKRCWERSGGVPLIDQIRAALNDDKFPLYVAEGTTAAKLSRIRHSGYLQRSLKSFAEIARKPDAALFVFGHSLAANDAHVLGRISKGKISSVYVSFYGDPKSSDNRDLVARAEKLASERDESAPLDIALYDAESAHVWG
ncbi:MAG: DUF4917 family protein [Rhizobiales bacterium]|jgi:hypothetical protein|nr:DUF4917 family protein [Hyphomicrobiales bacterium]